MRVLILDGREVLYGGEADEAVMPGRDGEFSVLDLHRPFLYRLRRGIVKVRGGEAGGDARLFKIKDGLARFSENKLLILCKRG